MREELLSPDLDPVDIEVEVGLRPRRLDDFVGQTELKGPLRVMLAAAAERGEAADHFLFAGPPGLGKTTLAQGILWGVGADEYARSPTFVLVNEYVARLPVYHIDLYRTGSSDEVADLGLDEYLFGDGVCVVEWPERAPAYFPQEHALIELDVTAPTTRGITVSSTSARYSRTIEALAGAEKD